MQIGFPLQLLVIFLSFLTAGNGETFGEIPVDMAKSIFFEVNFLGLNFYENNSKLIDLL